MAKFMLFVAQSLNFTDGNFKMENISAENFMLWLAANLNADTHDILKKSDTINPNEREIVRKVVKLLSKVL